MAETGKARSRGDAVSFFNPRFGFEPGPGFHLAPLLGYMVFWAFVALAVVAGAVLEWLL